MFRVLRNRARFLPATLVLIGSAFVLTACGGDDGDDAAVQSPGPPSNRAPTISGTPTASVLFSRQYSFTPTAADADGNTLTFSIQGRPAWATFSAATGRLQGAPAQADVGAYSNIRISVTDGVATTDLPAFSVQVVAAASGTALLSWMPPTQNSDGSPLTDLSAYRVYFGTSAGDYPNSMTLNNAGLSSFVVDQLTPATWYFVVTAINAGGVESPLSNVATKTVL